jgi:hypothetical protein
VPVLGERARLQRKGGVLRRFMMSLPSVRGMGKGKGKDVVGRGAYVPLEDVEP